MKNEKSTFSVLFYLKNPFVSSTLETKVYFPGFTTFRNLHSEYISIELMVNAILIFFIKNVQRYNILSNILCD